MALKSFRNPGLLPSILNVAVSTTPRLLSLTCARVPVACLHTTAAKMSLEDWKTQAPYKIHENDPNFHARYEGGCHCGRVKYQLSREKPLDAKYCHCTTCQKLHGTSFDDSVIGLPQLNRLQAPRSSGLRFSTKKISTSLKASTTSDGTTAPRRRPSTNYLAKSVAPTAVHQSWTRGGT